MQDRYFAVCLSGSIPREGGYLLMSHFSLGCFELLVWRSVRSKDRMSCTAAFYDRPPYT